MNKPLTKLEKAIESLHRSERRIARLFLNHPAPMVITTVKEGRIINANARIADLLGCRRDELIGRTSDELGFWVDPNERAQRMEQLNLEGAVQNRVTKIRCRSGELRDVMLSVEIIEIEGETEPAAIWMANDITDLKRTEELLRAREQEISAIADNIPGLIDYIDSEGRILYANKQHEEWFGVPRSEIVGKHYSQAYPAAAIERIKDGMELLRAGKAVRYEALHPWAHPTPRWVLANYVPDLDDQGKLKGFFLWGIDITERKQAEEALRASEEKFRALIEHSSEAIGLVDAQGMRLFESPAAKRILGYSDHEILGQSVLKFVHPDEVEHMRELWVRCVSEPGASQTVECRLKHKDGSWRWVEATATNMLNIPAVHAMVFNYHDITERKRAEDQIRFQASLLDQVTNGVAASDLDGKIIYWNHYAEVLHGWKGEEVLGKRGQDFLVPPSEIQRVRELMQSIISLSESEIDLLMLKKDESCFPAHVNYVVMKNNQGEPIGILGVSTDITERKQAEEALRASEAKLKQAQQLTHIGYYELDLVADRITASEETRAIFGRQFPPDLAVRRAEFEGMIHPDDRQRQHRALNQALQGSRFHDEEFRIVRPDGNIRFLHVRDEIVYDESGKPVRLFGAVKDITESKQVEEALRESEAKLKQAQQLAHIGYYERDLIADRIIWSEGVCNILGLAAPSYVLSQAELQKMIHPEDRQIQEQVLSAAQQGKKLYDVEYRIIRPDGDIRFVHVRDEVEHDHSGKPIRIFGTAQDITERKQAEEKIQQYSARLQTLSNQLLAAQEQERRTIARELHDEIGQVVTAVSTGLQGIRHARSPAMRTKRLNETIALVDQTWNRIRALALDLRPSMLDDFGLVPALDWYLKQQAERSGFKSSFAVELPPLRFEPNLETTVFRIAQIALTNVARHAHAKHVAVELRLRAAHLEIVIRDDGVGFDVPSALDRAAHGASMGLSSLQERVRLVRGELEIQSSPGQGTEIRARFPIPGKEMTEDESKFAG